MGHIYSGRALKKESFHLATAQQATTQKQRNLIHEHLIAIWPLLLIKCALHVAGHAFCVETQFKGHGIVMNQASADETKQNTSSASSAVPQQQTKGNEYFKKQFQF